MDDVDYRAFIDRKTQLDGDHGFDPIWMPDFLFPLQEALTTWAVRKGRGAIFADTGLGKTLDQLVWGENVHRRTNRPVLILAPPVVSIQTAREAERFGMDCRRTTDGTVHAGLNITNYERLHLYSPDDFAGVVLDESAILKDFDGMRRQQITDFMRKMPYRLLCSATPSPNEYVELGTSSEALGYLGYMDMLTRFFKNDQGNSIKPHIYRNRGQHFTKLDDRSKWRFKGHAEKPFWRWVCSWARAVRRPSDLGLDDGPYVLPPLVERQHVVKARTLPDGMLFSLPAFGLSEQRDERRRTIDERCEMAADLVRHTEPFAIWCDLNQEGDRLEKLLRSDCVQISGKDTDESKEAKFLDYIDGNVRGLVTKGTIGAWGLNFQHCAHSVCFPTHSFERYFQQLRRFWRFGQKLPVRSDIVTTEGELDVLANMQRKAAAADHMFGELVAHMRDEMQTARIWPRSRWHRRSEAWLCHNRRGWRSILCSPFGMAVRHREVAKVRHRPQEPRPHRQPLGKSSTRDEIAKRG